MQLSIRWVDGCDKNSVYETTAYFDMLKIVIRYRVARLPVAIRYPLRAAIAQVTGRTVRVVLLK